MKFRRDISYLLLLFLSMLVYYGPALADHQVFFLRDLALEIVAKRWFWVHSHGFYLWNPYCFFGMPEAANLQSEVFYPLNFIFLCFGAERGLVYYIFFHHTLLCLGSYLALRRLGFGPESSLVGSAGFGLGGFAASLTHLVVLLTTAAWFPFLLIFLKDAVDRNWLNSSLLLGLVMAFMILAGEIEIAAMSMALAIAAVALGPEFKSRSLAWERLLSSVLCGAVIAAVLTLFQTAITMQMVPLSNRSQGLDIETVLKWSLSPHNLKLLVVPNYLLPLSAGRFWSLGFFNQFPYFHSYYLGAVIAASAVLAIFFKPPRKSRGMDCNRAGSARDRNGPGASGLQVPLPICSADEVFPNPGKIFLCGKFRRGHPGCFRVGSEGSKNPGLVRGLRLVFLVCGLIIGALLILFPVKAQEFGNRYEYISQYLFLRAALRALCFLLLAVSVMLLTNEKRKTWAGAGLGLLALLDLGLAHSLLNPAVDKNFYRPNSMVQELLLREKGRPEPVRIAALKPDSQELVMKKLTDPVRALLQFQKCARAVLVAVLRPERCHHGKLVLCLGF